MFLKSPAGSTDEVKSCGHMAPIIIEDISFSRHLFIFPLLTDWLCPLNHPFLALRTLSVFYFSPSAVVPGKRYPPGRLHSHLFVCPPPVLPQSCSRDSGYRQSQLPCQFVTLILRLFWRLRSLRRKASSFCASVSSLPNLSPSLPSRNFPRSP